MCARRRGAGFCSNRSKSQLRIKGEFGCAGSIGFAAAHAGKAQPDVQCIGADARCGISKRAYHSLP